MAATVSASLTMSAPVGRRRASNWLRVTGGQPRSRADLGEGFGVAGEEVVGGLLVGVGDVAEGVDADLESLGSVAGALACFAVDVDEGTEAMRLAADDGDHEGKAEHAGADEGLRRAADAEPDGERVLDAGAGRRPGR